MVTQTQRIHTIPHPTPREKTMSDKQEVSQQVLRKAKKGDEEAGMLVVEKGFSMIRVIPDFEIDFGDWKLIIDVKGFIKQQEGKKIIYNPHYSYFKLKYNLLARHLIENEQTNYKIMLVQQKDINRMRWRIENYLKGGTVTAAAPTAFYLGKKLLQRNYIPWL